MWRVASSAHFSLSLSLSFDTWTRTHTERCEKSLLLHNAHTTHNLRARRKKGSLCVVDPPVLSGIFHHHRIREGEREKEREREREEKFPTPCDWLIAVALQPSLPLLSPSLPDRPSFLSLSLSLSHSHPVKYQITYFPDLYISMRIRIKTYPTHPHFSNTKDRHVPCSKAILEQGREQREREGG